MRVGIIGAGPSGLSLARILSNMGYAVKVYEVQRDFAVKPCGWAYPELDEEERGHEVLAEGLRSAMWRYEGYKGYLDDRLVYYSRERVLGYIVDKRDFLARLAEGLDVEMGSSARYAGRGVVRSSRGEEKHDLVVIAGGFPSQPRPLERILAIQVQVRAPRVEEPELPELRFYSDLVGYAWVFPEDEKRARVGVGGYAGREVLEKILRGVLRSREDLARGEVLRSEGALVTVSGVDWGLAESRDPYYVGESVGYVMPATGEGIRAGVWSSIALARSMEKGTSYADELRKLKLTRFIRIHRRLVELMLRVSPRERGEFLTGVPEDLLVKLSLGRASAQDLLRAISSPQAAKILAKGALSALLSAL